MLLKLCLIFLFVFINHVISFEFERDVIMENSQYKPYEELFKKRPNLHFNDTYSNQYILHSNKKIHRDNFDKLNVCFSNFVRINDTRYLPSEYDKIFKDSRKITEYIFSKISKYTSLKFYLTESKCDIEIDFKTKLNARMLGVTNFWIYHGKPQAKVAINFAYTKIVAQYFRISLLRILMQVIMHEVLHALGVDHIDKEHTDVRSIAHDSYDSSAQQLLYKKDVFTLRSIYGERSNFSRMHPDPPEEELHLESTLDTTTKKLNTTEFDPKLLLQLQKEFSKIKYGGLIYTTSLHPSENVNFENNSS